MTRRDYELIAGVFATTEAVCARSAWDAVWRDRTRVANAMADALAADNPRFDRARFLAACGATS